MSLRSLSVAIGVTLRTIVIAALALSLLFNGLLIFSSTVSSAVAAATAAIGLRSVAARQMP